MPWGLFAVGAGVGVGLTLSVRRFGNDGPGRGLRGRCRGRTSAGARPSEVGPDQSHPDDEDNDGRMKNRTLALEGGSQAAEVHQQVEEQEDAPDCKPRPAVPSSQGLSTVPGRSI
jgi:hypothetical protein